MVSGTGVGEIVLSVCGRLAIAGMLRIDVVGGCPFGLRFQARGYSPSYK